MTNDSDNQAAAGMDHALRDYASRRRVRWGGPREMPPHVRQRLHQEIERSHATDGLIAVPSWKRALAFLARRWEVAGLLGALALALVVWIWPDAPPQELAARSVDNEPAAPPAAAVDVPAPQPLSDDAGLPRDRFLSTAAPPTAAPEVPAPAATAVPTRPAGGATVSRNATAPERVNRPESGPSLRLPAPTLASQPAPKPVPAPASGPAPAGSGAPVQALFSQSPAQAPRPALNTFRLEQVAAGFQIVDEDGSVYPASLRLAAAEADPASVPVAAPSVMETRVQKRPTAASPARSSRAIQSAPPPLPPVIAVQAAGTNRGLRQRVVVAGNLVPSNTVGAPVLPDPAAWLTNQRALQYLFSNSRIEGQAVLGGSNEFSIRAAPAAP